MTGSLSAHTIAVDNGYFAMIGGVKSGGGPPTKRVINGVGVVATDKMIAQNCACTSRLIWCFVCPSAVGCYLFRVLEDVFPVAIALLGDVV